ncbi:MAG: hypothetical protein SNJ78_10745 [Spirochaetales bacterium]
MAWDTKRQEASLPRYPGSIEVENSQVIQDFLQGPFSTCAYPTAAFVSKEGSPLGLAILSRYPILHSITHIVQAGISLLLRTVNRRIQGVCNSVDENQPFIMILGDLDESYDEFYRGGSAANNGSTPLGHKFMGPDSRNWDSKNTDPEF